MTVMLVAFVLLVSSAWRTCAVEEKPTWLSWTVNLRQGSVRGYLDREGRLFGFYGIPYATAPTGHDKFKGPLPEPMWNSTLDAVDKTVSCLQRNPLNLNLPVHENCLVVNVFVPDVNKTNLPVVVMIHDRGEYRKRHLFTPKNLVRSQKVVAVTFNFRLGALGYLCLGTLDVPGNAALKDQVAALRWVKTNIASFKGNPNDVTVYGYDTGAADVELLILSKSTEGLFHRAILDSGSALAYSSVQLHPIDIAVKTLKSMIPPVCNQQFDSIYQIENCYKSIPDVTLMHTVGVNDWYRNNFELSACIERDVGVEMFLEDSPINILKKGDYNKVPMLYGFNAMEGLDDADVGIFNTIAPAMDQNFSNFLPPDLYFSNKTDRENIAKHLKESYFGNMTIDIESVVKFANFSGDKNIIYPILRSVNSHVRAGNGNIYLYQYQFSREIHLSSTDIMLNFTDAIFHGANHYAQTNAVLDTVPNYDTTGVSTRNPIVESDKEMEDYNEMRRLLRTLWLNFITTGFVSIK